MSRETRNNELGAVIGCVCFWSARLWLLKRMAARASGNWLRVVESLYIFLGRQLFSEFNCDRHIFESIIFPWRHLTFVLLSSNENNLFSWRIC